MTKEEKNKINFLRESIEKGKKKIIFVVSIKENREGWGRIRI